LNEILRRALLQAQLSEDDVAARLAVDPKTVRRWTEGRIPYRRHRWELAHLLGRDEVELWPQASPFRPRPRELLAVYPHRAKVPVEVWLTLFRSAVQEIDVLADGGDLLDEQAVIMDVLGDRLRAGVKVRICVSAPEGPALANRSAEALAKYVALRGLGTAEIRLHELVVANAVYRADDQMLVAQYIYGVPAEQTPVLHLRRVNGGEMMAVYADSFELVWASAQRTA